jgi:hypothetical protein
MAADKTLIPKKFQIPIMLLAAVVFAALLFRQFGGTPRKPPRPAVPGPVQPAEGAATRRISLDELVRLVADIQAAKTAQVARAAEPPALARNPFCFPVPGAPEGDTALEHEPVATPQPVTPPDHGLIRRTLALKSLQLSGTCLLEGRATALINGKYLGVGGRIEGFTVTEIRDREVVIQDRYGEEVLTLKKELDL